MHRAMFFCHFEFGTQAFGMLDMLQFNKMQSQEAPTEKLTGLPGSDGPNTPNRKQNVPNCCNKCETGRISSVSPGRSKQPGFQKCQTAFVFYQHHYKRSKTCLTMTCMPNRVFSCYIARKEIYARATPRERLQSIKLYTTHMFISTNVV